jgi:hypothetical protein
MVKATKITINRLSLVDSGKWIPAPYGTIFTGMTKANIYHSETVVAL